MGEPRNRFSFLTLLKREYYQIWITIGDDID